MTIAFDMFQLIGAYLKHFNTQTNDNTRSNLYITSQSKYKDGF